MPWLYWFRLCLRVLMCRFRVVATAPVLLSCYGVWGRVKGTLLAGVVTVAFARR